MLEAIFIFKRLTFPFECARSLVINILFIVSFIIELDIESANQQNYAMQIAIDD